MSNHNNESRPAPAVQVPEGWALVPVEPTPEMLAATSWPGCAATDYEHMLAAAPAPATVATEAVALPNHAWEVSKGKTTCRKCGAVLTSETEGTKCGVYPLEAVAQGGGVGVEKVMALVEEYGRDMARSDSAPTSRAAEAYRQCASDTLAQIRALLTPATCKTSLQVVGWIPVGERLPDMEAGYVLVHCEGGKIGDDFFCRNREFLHHSGNRYSRKHQGKESGYFQSSHMYGYRITHWQPLPPPPAIAKENSHE